MTDTAKAVTAALCLAVVVSGGAGGACYGCPKYRVYEQALEGEAELKRAEANRQVAVYEAEAKKEAAKSLAQAEVERAKGVAEANKIIGESLSQNEAYLRYLWIQSIGNGNREIVYVPTEANLPILEAGRLNAPVAK